MKRTALACVALLCLGPALARADGQEKPSDGTFRPVPQTPAWQQLRTLVGHWEGWVGEGEKRAPPHVEVRMTGGGSAVMRDAVNLLLISPLTSKSLLGADFYFRMPTLGLLRVAGATPPEWTVTILDEKTEPIDFSQPVDLVGITGMTPAMDRAYEIADAFRARGIPVVMGGIHFSMMPEEAQVHCDEVLIGEAENLWPRLLGDFRRGAMQRLYRHETFPSLTILGAPEWSPYAGNKYLPFHCVETSRGCPHRCEFCAGSVLFCGRYRQKPAAKVLAELDRVLGDRDFGLGEPAHVPARDLGEKLPPVGAVTKLLSSASSMKGCKKVCNYPQIFHKKRCWWILISDEGIL